MAHDEQSNNETDMVSSLTHDELKDFVSKGLDGFERFKKKYKKLKLQLLKVAL